MPRNIVELVDILSVPADSDGIFIGNQPSTGRLARVFGGQVAAQALQAAAQTVDGGRLAHSLHAYFVLGGDPSVPIRYEVTRIRDGGSFTTRRVAALQHGREIFHLMASFHGVEPGLKHSMQPAETAGPEDPETLPTVADVLRERGGVDAHFWSSEWRELDMRVGSPVARAGGLRRQRIWFRLKDPLNASQAMHRTVLTYMSDLTLLSAAIAPHGYFVGSAQIQRASLDHAVWFHDDVNVNNWLLYDQESPWAAGGRGLARAEIYGPSGRLVASVVQEGLMRPRDRGQDSRLRS